MRTLLSVCLTCLLVVPFVVAPVAAQTTATLPVTANVVNTCVIAAAPLVFAYNPTAGTDTTATSLITVTTCFDPHEIAIDACTNGGGTTTTRQMDLAGTKLDYTLDCSTEADPQCTSNWGEVNGTDTLTGTPGALETYTVDGTVAAGQTVASGAYLDSCTVSLVF